MTTHHTQLKQMTKRYAHTYTTQTVLVGRPSVLLLINLSGFW